MHNRHHCSPYGIPCLMRASDLPAIHEDLAQAAGVPVAVPADDDRTPRRPVSLYLLAHCQAQQTTAHDGGGLQQLLRQAAEHELQQTFDPDQEQFAAGYHNGASTAFNLAAEAFDDASVLERRAS